MSRRDPDQDQPLLPLRADPAAGALVGTFLVALCLGGPVGLGLALIVWIGYEAVRRLLWPPGGKRGEHRDRSE